MKKFYSDYLTFSRKERWGLLSFLVVVTVLYFLPDWINNAPSDLKEVKLLSASVDSSALDSGERSSNRSSDSYKSASSSGFGFLNKELFRFDPNSATVKDWERLGLNARIAAVIENYKAKGGQFRKPEDLKKIWGLPPAFYERVRPYISIQGSSGTTYSALPSLPIHKDKESVYLNSSDTTDWIALPGIGSKLANRIINFREKLGGFHSIDQVRETYGLSDSVFHLISKQLIAEPGRLRKIRLNSATKEELKEHPYIRWNLAGAIVEYRNQHGLFTSLDQLRNIQLMEEKTLSKLLPYLSLD